MSATSSEATASLSVTSASGTPAIGSTPGKEDKKRADPGDVFRTFFACGLCGDLYSDPKLLPCFHSFCKRCLASYIPDHSLSLACPTCRQHSILPVAGVSALRDNQFLTQLLHKMERFGRRRQMQPGQKNRDVLPIAAIVPEDGVADDNRGDCSVSVQDKFDSTGDDTSCEMECPSEVFDDQSVRAEERTAANDLLASMSNCLQHDSSSMSHFCVECDTAICTECLGAEHRRHSVQNIEEFSSTERSSLCKILANVKEYSKAFDTSLRNIAKTKLKLDRQKVEAEETVERSFTSLQEALERRKESILAELEVASLAKMDRLKEQETDVGVLKRTIEECCAFMDSCLSDSTNFVGLILAKKELSEKLEQLCKLNVQLLPEENPFLSFHQGKLAALCDVANESLRILKNPTLVLEASPTSLKSAKTRTNDIRRTKLERHQKGRKTASGKLYKASPKTGDSADSEASSESSGGTSVVIGPQDFGSVVSNSAVPYETIASGEHLRRCFLNMPAVVTVTTKTSKGLNVNKGGSKISAKVYTLEVGYRSKCDSIKSERRSSDGSVLVDMLMPPGAQEPKDAGTENAVNNHQVHKDQKVSFLSNNVSEDPVNSEDAPPDASKNRMEDVVTITKAEDLKERSVYKRTLVVPEIVDLGDGSYELAFTLTENTLRRYPHGNHSSLDVSKSAVESGRLTPQSPCINHRELHSSLDKLQQKKRPKSAPECSELLSSVQLEIKLYGQQIKGSPFSVKVKKEIPKLQKDQKTSSSSNAFLSSRHSSDFNKRHSSSGAVKRPMQNLKFCNVTGNRKPSSASASQNDGPCQRIGSKGHNKGEFINLQGIAVYEDRIFVADSNGQCVQVFSCDGKCILRFGAKGRSPGQLQRPTGVTCTPDGQHILVSDYENKWVGVYTNEGRYLNRIGHGKLAGPKGVSIDKQGRVVIVDNRSSTVWLYTLSGKVLGKFGARGICASSGSSSPSASSPSGFISTTEAHARLAGPHFCAIDPDDGDVVVTDFHNHRVKVFSSEGKYKFSFGSAGEGNGQFSAPTGICVDKQGNILVADWGNSRIQIFDKNGSFLSHIDTSPDPLYGPQGLAIGPDNSVVVADSGNHCLKVYKHLFM